MARRALRGPKAAESLQSKEDWLRLKYICWFATLIVGCGDTSKDGRQQLSDTSFKGHEEIVSDVLHTRRVSCPSLKYLVRERMLRQLRDARQKHASRMRLSAKSEMPCTQVGNSSREPRLTRIGKRLLGLSYFKGPEEIVSDILFTWRTATHGARLHILMAYSEWLRVSECKPAFSFASQGACDCNDELHREGSPPARATRLRETVAHAKYVHGAYGSMAVLVCALVGCTSLRSLLRERMFDSATLCVLSGWLIVSDVLMTRATLVPRQVHRRRERHDEDVGLCRLAPQGVDVGQTSPWWCWCRLVSSMVVSRSRKTVEFVGRPISGASSVGR
jgi:hypothetical protein